MTTKPTVKKPRKAEVIAQAPTREEVMAGIRANMVDALVAHAQAVDTEKMFQSIISDVKKTKDELTMELIGVSNRWGKPEVDHCNGRLSALDSELREQYGPLIRSIVLEETTSVIEAIRNDKDHAMRRAIRKELNEKLSPSGYEMRNAVAAAATEIVRDLVTEQKEQFRKELLSN